MNPDNEHRSLAQRRLARKAKKPSTQGKGVPSYYSLDDLKLLERAAYEENLTLGGLQHEIVKAWLEKRFSPEYEAEQSQKAKEHEMSLPPSVINRSQTLLEEVAKIAEEGLAKGEVRQLTWKEMEERARHLEEITNANTVSAISADGHLQEAARDNDRRDATDGGEKGSLQTDAASDEAAR